MNVASAVTVALLTPLDKKGHLDHEALGGLVEAALAGGVTGISPLGSTGEGYSLGLDDRLAVITTVVARTETPVIAGLFPIGPAQAIAEIAEYKTAGATAVLLAPPTYFPLDPAECEAYFRGVADASPLPLIMYNIPVFTKISIPPAVVASLASHEMIAGIKDSSRDFGYFLSVADAVAATGADFGVLTGSDAMLMESLLAGGAGTICASANVVPELSVGIYAAVGRGDLTQARTLAVQLRQVLRACQVAAPAGIKAAAAARGLCRPDMVPPRRGLDEAQSATLVKELRRLGIVG